MSAEPINNGKVDHFLELSLTIKLSLAMEMTNQGINNAELARRLGVSRACITDIMKRDNIGLEVLARLAQAIGCQWKIQLVKE